MLMLCDARSHETKGQLAHRVRGAGAGCARPPRQRTAGPVRQKSVAKCHEACLTYSSDLDVAAPCPLPHYLPVLPWLQVWIDGSVPGWKDHHEVNFKLSPYMG